MARSLNLKQLHGFRKLLHDNYENTDQRIVVQPLPMPIDDMENKTLTQIHDRSSGYVKK